MNFKKVTRLVLFGLLTATCANNDQLKYVDPRIGNVGLILEPTRPTVQLPNQMIRVYPNRKDHLDDYITSFPLTLISHRLGQLFGIMPFTGSVEEIQNIKSLWDAGNEVSTPYYYSVFLNDYQTLIEFVPGSKSGVFSFTFPSNAKKNIVLNVVNKGHLEKVNSKMISGEENFNGMKAFVYGEFSHSVEIFTDTSRFASSDKKGLILTFIEDAAPKIEFRYAISFISEEQAKNNFNHELPGKTLVELKEAAKVEWEKVLSRIQVEGGNEKQKRTFYTALYRCYERMTNISEDGWYYSNYDGKVHESDRTFYADDWIWDTYLAHHPLRCILDPETEADMIDSYVNMYLQSGWLPTFPVLWGDNPCMNGFHSNIMILDAYNKGIRNFDVAAAYEGMRKNALSATMLPWRNGPACELDSFYYHYGFYPALHPNETETEPLVHPFEKRQSVAITLGHCYDDWALSKMAVKLGENDDADLFAKRSFNYRNLYCSEKHFFLPKDKDGKWIDIDPVFDGGMGGRDYYDENNGWTYLWQVQHNIPDLINLMGGEKAFINRLDQLFSQSLGRSKYSMWAKFPDFTGITGQFSMGNEPSFHIPYLYNFTSEAWKTQRRIRSLLNNWFPDNIFGIPGDEDGGGMSAFIVFSSMGFYPVVPGIPVYTIGSPVFNKITIQLPNGKTFRIEARNNSEKNVYIHKASLNGKPLKGPWFTHEELMNGGNLILEMGALPETEWHDTTLFQQYMAK